MSITWKISNTFTRAEAIEAITQVMRQNTLWPGGPLVLSNEEIAEAAINTLENLNVKNVHD